MSFFSRPNLENLQFKQTTDVLLGLSGQTQILSTSGFTLSNDAGGNIIVTASGASSSTNMYVLTYRHDLQKIVLASGATAGGSGFYPYDEHASVDVGGITGNVSGVTGTGYYLYNQQIVDILHDMLVPTLYPTITQPSSTFSIDPTTLIYQVGDIINITGTSVFDRGSITPPYGTSGFTSGEAITYEYIIQGITYTGNSVYDISFSITGGSNTILNNVYYSQGEQPLNSTGGTYSTALPSGVTTGSTLTITGIYPYFYGKVASGGVGAGLNRPSSTAALITGGTSVLETSDGTISIDYNSTNDDYIWFAIPTASTFKTKWYVDTINNGNIGGSVSSGGNLFPDLDSVTGVSTTYWSGQTYQLYISNYQTELTEIIEFRNT